MKNKMTLYYIGDNFYSESGTMMSSIYHSTGERSDWGDVQCMLRDGMELEIVQAPDSFLVQKYRQLDEYKKKRLAQSA